MHMYPTLYQTIRLFSGGSDDIYIQITASQGNPTFQYGLELIGTTPRDDLSIPDGMDG